MNTSELLNELRTNVLRDAESADSLWSDESLIVYLNNSYEEFAEETLTIRDKTTAAVTQIILSSGVVDYALHEAVLAVYSARYNTDIYDLPLVTHPIQRGGTLVDTNWFDVNGSAAVLGRPTAYQLDEASKILTVYPTPTSVEQGKKLFLRVARLPLTLFSVGADITPEIPRRYHITLADGAAAEALSSHDVDGEAVARATKRRGKFDRAMWLARRRFRRLNKAPIKIDLGRYSWP